jgi:hypothetical protein
MIKPRAIFAKVKRDQVLNLSELAIASGYDRAVLSRMDLPLESGKISLADFKLVLRKRAARHERQRLVVMPPAEPAPAGSDCAQTRVDKFHAPRSKCDPPGASRPRAESPALCTG